MEMEKTKPGKHATMCLQIFTDSTCVRFRADMSDLNLTLNLQYPSTTRKLIPFTGSHV